MVMMTTVIMVMMLIYLMVFVDDTALCGGNRIDMAEYLLMEKSAGRGGTGASRPNHSGWNVGSSKREGRSTNHENEGRKEGGIVEVVNVV